MIIAIISIVLASALIAWRWVIGIDFMKENHPCPSLATLKPKASIPLKRILSVSEIMDEDKKKYKKLAKAPDIAFKVVY